MKLREWLWMQLQFSSVTQSCLNLCDPLDCSTPSFPVYHQLPELVQTHVHQVGDVIQPSHLLQPPSPIAFPVSGSFLKSWLFASGGQSAVASASASVLPMNIQGWFPLGWTCLISLQSKELSRVFSNTTIWKYQFFGTQPSLWSNSLGTSLVAQTVKCLPTVWETWVQSLGREDPLEKEMATHFSTLAWKIPWMEEPGRLQSMGLQRVRHDWVTELN